MNPEFLAFSILILLFSVIVHEVMHGFMALQFGDHTAEDMGRLTLNPLPHIDPFGTVLLPLLLIVSGSPVLFGWAKPVPVNPLNFTNIRKGELWVSVAGILSNLSLAIISAIILHFLGSSSTQDLLSQLLFFAVTINLVLAVFNLIPIPPLDGSKVVLSLLPYHLAKEYQKMEKYGFIILLLLMFIPFGGGTIIGTILGVGVGFLRHLLVGF